VDPTFNPFEAAQPTTAPHYTKTSVEGWQELYEVTKEGQNRFSSVQFESESVPTEFFDSDDTELNTAPITFQLQRKYIVTKIKSALLVINQNRAHQRVLYERFLKTMADGKVVGQELLFPVEVSFTKPELSILQQLLDDLVAAGFQIQIVEDDYRAVIKTIPAMMSEANIGTLLQDYVKDFEDEPQKHITSDAEGAARSLARGMAIKNGQPLALESQIALVNDLFGCSEPQLSPFKKLTYITLGDNELENKFL